MITPAKISMRYVCSVEAEEGELLVVLSDLDEIISSKHRLHGASLVAVVADYGTTKPFFLVIC